MTSSDIGGLTLRQSLIKRLMLLRETEIDFDIEKGADFRELFNHPDYLDMSADAQSQIVQRWTAALYEQERKRPLFEEYFPGLDLSSFFRNSRMLDIGCYIGGKTVAWGERYGATVHGIDIEQKFIDAASQFALARQARATFSVTYADALPFPDRTFNVIVSENTFEHVPDVAKVLDECARVLTDDGVLVVIFPPLFSPFKGHHLDLVSRTPALQWFFKYPDILKAYFSILDDRGSKADWYRRREEQSLPFEKGYSVNGTSAREFRQLIKPAWTIAADGFEYRRAGNGLKRKLVGMAKSLPLDLVREMFPIAYVLRKLQR